MKRTALLITAVTMLAAGAPGRAQTRAQAEATMAQMWEAFEDLGRWGYVRGFASGSEWAYIKMAERSDNGHIPALPRWAVLENPSQVAAVMTDLYRDPANVNIDIAVMVWIARDKLRSDDVSASLQFGRALGASR